MKAGDIVRTRHNVYRILDEQYAGGYGLIFAAERERDNAIVAVKFCAPISDEARNDPLCDEIETNAIQRFNDEIFLMRRLPRQPYFPRYFEKGVHRGRPFFVMEALRELSEADWPPKTDKERVRFVCDLCDAVQDLHDLGYVHYDIKPSNVMCRLSGDMVEHWVLIDFGSAHEKEDDVRIENCLTRSVLSDGRRMIPSTPGYADPVWKLHSVRFDIYSIGQVIRDLFEGDVPLHWSRIIDRCISRNPKYRYETVNGIMRDVIEVKKYGLIDIRHQLNGWILEDVACQERIARENMRIVSWEELQDALHVTRVVDSGWPLDGCLVENEQELMIESLKKGMRHIEITTPVVLDEKYLFVMKGPGIVEMDLSVTSKGLHCVVLMNNMTLINTSRRKPNPNSVCYYIGTGCYLNFVGLKNSELDVDAFRLSAAGGAFLRCKGPETVREIIEELDASPMRFSNNSAQPLSIDGFGAVHRFIHAAGWFKDAMGLLSEGEA